jgi:hypothetical protein
MIGLEDINSDPNLSFVIENYKMDIPVSNSFKFNDLVFTNDKTLPININKGENKNLFLLNFIIEEYEMDFIIVINKYERISKLIERIETEYINDLDKVIENMYINGKNIDLNTTIIESNIGNNENINLYLKEIENPIHIYFREINDFYSDTNNIIIDMNYDGTIPLDIFLDSEIINNQINIIESDIMKLSYNYINERYPLIKWNSEENENMNECIICYLPIKNDEFIRELNCNHKYHSGCIDKWLTQFSNKCPFCKMGQ